MAGTILTKKGIALIAKLVATKGALTFTKAAVGTGRTPEGYDAGGMTQLNTYKMDGKIASCTSEENVASVVFQVSSTDVEQSFVLTEAGLFATDPDEGEILYAYMDMSKDPQYVYAKGGAVSKFVEIELKVAVGELDKITVVVNPNSLVTNNSITDKTDVTEKGQHVLDAVQANPKVDGTLANQIARIHNVAEITLTAANWSAEAPYTQEVSVPGLKATDKPQMMSAVKKDTPATDIKAWEKMAGMIKAAEALDGQAKFYCPITKPTADFKIKLVGVSVNG